MMTMSMTEPVLTEDDLAPETITVEVEPEPVKAEPAPKAEQTFTAADIERVRKEEKDKLYGKIDGLEKTAKELLAEKTQRDKDAADAKAAAEKEAKAAREAEMSAKELIEAKEQEWQTRFETLEAERAREKAETAALLEKEQQYNSLLNYRATKLEEAGVKGTIADQLLDYVWGDTPEQIDEAIAIAQEKSASILEEVQSAQAAARANLRGTAATAPPVGPMENETTNKTFTVEELNDMDMASYQKNRQALMRSVSRKVSERGLYG